MFSFLTAFAGCLILIPLIIRFAERRRLFDIPDQRKIHDEEIPRLGGIAVMGAFLISFFLYASPENLFEMRFFLAGMIMLFFLGLWDDLLPVKPIVKLAGQILPIALLSWNSPFPFVEILDLSGLPGWINWPATLFLGFWIINSFNLIDGINGLAGSIGLISLVGAAYLMPEVNVLCLAMGGALFAFLFFNAYRPNIFIGDCGSLLIGYCMVFLVTNATVDSQQRHIPLLLLFTLIALPLFDMARVFVIRLSKRKNPFRGDRNHLHHLLLETGASHLQATLILCALTVLNTGIIYLLASTIGKTWQAAHLLLPAILPLIFTLVLWEKVRKIRQTETTSP